MLEQYRQALAGLCIYRNILADPIIKGLLSVLDVRLNREAASIEVLDRYYEFLYKIFDSGISFREYLLDLILYDDNLFSRTAEKNKIEYIDPALSSAVNHDLYCLELLYRLDFKNIEDVMGIVDSGIQMQNNIDSKNSMKVLLDRSSHWPSELEALADYYYHHSRGIAARYTAFRYAVQEGLIGIAKPDIPDMDDLIGCERQKEQLCANTENFLKGYPANNILLYGPRGTGKSSMIKSLLNKYQAEKLRIVQISREQIDYLPDLMKDLAAYNLKFIIFMDDLSFEEYETEYKGLKAVLEGSLTRHACNVLLYATSNRRHLVREFFSDRGKAGEEVHGMDTMQEKLSLADRFGLCITFETPDRKKYLQMVEYMAEKRHINMEPEALRNRALEWERNRHGPSGRTARQFIDSLGAGQNQTGF